MGNFNKSYSYDKLLKSHTLAEKGIWHILGEDSNCDFGGSHYQPSLMYVEGTLKDALEVAELIPRFYTWGGGGDIQKISISNCLDQIGLLNKQAVKKRALDKLTETEKKVLGLKH